MNGLLLVCLSLIVSVVSPIGSFSDPVAQRAFHNATPTYSGSYHIEGWGNETQSDSHLPAVLEEFIVDTSITYVGALGRQESPSVAFDGTNYLVVWEDTRIGPSYDIWGARVSPSGTVLDPSGISISTAAEYHGLPSVTFDGVNYFVVWTDCRDNACHIYGARVSPAGSVLDPSGIAISPALQWPEYASVAFDGNNYLVVWHDYSSGPDHDIWGARVDASGTVLDTSGIAISKAGGRQSLPSVAFDGSNYLVVWMDSRDDTSDVYGARVSPSGSLLDSFGIPIYAGADWQGIPCVAFDGINYLVVWTDFRNDTLCDIYGTRVSPAGSVLDSLAIAISTAPYLQVSRAVAFDGDNYLVVWGDSRDASPKADIYGARVDTSGAVLEPEGIAICTAPDWQGSPSVALDGTNYFVVWEDYRMVGICDIYGARVSPSGGVLDSLGVLLSTAANKQATASAAFDGTNYLVVWQDYRTDTSNIYGVRLSQLGVPLDSSSLPIGTGAFYQASPSLAYGNIDYLVVWEDSRSGFDAEVYGARVSQSGVVIDSLGFVIATGPYPQESPCVAFDGNNFLVVWDGYHSGTGYDVYGARISASGVVLDTLGIPIASGPDKEDSPCIAFDGTNYLVAWRVYAGFDSDIYGARISPSGTVLDPSGILISAAYEFQLFPSIAFGGSNYLVVWAQDTGSRSDICGVRVSPSGSVLDSFDIGICRAAYSQQRPTVAFDQSNYRVVWQDCRSNSHGDIYGTRVDTSGTVLDPLGIELIDEPYWRLSPRICGGPGGQALIVHHGFAGQPYNTCRVLGALYREVGVEEEPFSESHVSTFRLGQNFPNPFSNATAISYRIPKSRVRLKVYDSSGRLVNTLVDEERPAGSHSVIWNGRDKSGLKVPSGIYFYRLQAGPSTTTNKMILLR